MDFLDIFDQFYSRFATLCRAANLKVVNHLCCNFTVEKSVTLWVPLRIVTLGNNQYLLHQQQLRSLYHCLFHSDPIEVTCSVKLRLNSRAIPGNAEQKVKGSLQEMAVYHSNVRSLKYLYILKTMKFENLDAAFKETAREKDEQLKELQEGRDQQYKEQLKELQDQRVKLLEDKQKKETQDAPAKVPHTDRSSSMVLRVHEELHTFPYFADLIFLLFSLYYIKVSNRLIFQCNSENNKIEVSQDS